MSASDIDPARRAAWQVPSFSVLMTRERSSAFCVVIPVINEGVRMHSLLRRMAHHGISGFADIVIVDGGSTDGSLDMGLLRAEGVHTLLRKMGPGRLSAQLRCAYAFALELGYRGLVTIDGNDKDDPEAIPRFIAALEQGFDFVQASRFVAGGAGENTPRAREWAIRLVHAPLLTLFSGFHWTDTTQGFRAYSRRLLLDPRIAPFRDVFSEYELLAYLSYRAPRLGYRCIEIGTVRRYPPVGPVPTKISSFGGNLGVLATLFRACLGGFDPPTGEKPAAATRTP